MQVRLLGPLELVEAGGPVRLGAPKERRLLSLLAVYANEVVPEARICGVVWGECPPRSPRTALRSYVSRVRGVLNEDLVIETAAAGYRLVAPPGGTDVSELDVLAVQAQAAAAHADWSGAAQAATEGLSRFRGPVLADIADSTAALAPAARLEGMKAVLVEIRVEAELALGRHQELLTELEDLCRTYPWRQRLCSARMLALYRMGRQAEALEVFHDLRSRIGSVRELPTDLVDLERRIAAGDPDLGWTAPLGAEAATSRRLTVLVIDVPDPPIVGESAAEAEARDRREAATAQIVADHAGAVLAPVPGCRTAGSVFRHPADAATAAIDLQTVVYAPSQAEEWGSPARMALHLGGADGADVRVLLKAAASIGRLAPMGRVMCSAAAAEAIADDLPAGLELHDLRVGSGSDSSTRIVVLTAADARAVAEPPPTAGRGVRPALPAPLVLRSVAPFVGRVDELGALQRLAGEARKGIRNAAFIGGEPGIGKTRLVSEAANHAHRCGSLVLYGRCDEDPGVPFQPLVEALSTYVAACPVDLLATQCGPSASELARLLPEIRERLTDLLPATRPESETERHLMFEAVAEFVRAIAGQTPLMMVLDDLHWATKPTLLLLRHLLRRGGPPVFVVATYRDTELDGVHPLAMVLADLQREPGVHRLSLKGLEFDDVCAFVTGSAAGSKLNADVTVLARTLWEETDGNPFFVGELLTHALESGTVWREGGRRSSGDFATTIERDLPESVREAVTRRLSRLSTDANRTLLAASVLGATFSAGVLERVAGLGPEAFVEGLEDAVEAGLVAELGPDAYCFAHALIRRTLYGSIPQPRRRRMHRHVAEEIEALPSRRGRLEALAHHFAEAAEDGVAAKAAQYALAAGLEALERLAHEQSVSVLERGLTALDRAALRAPSLRCQILLVLAEVRDWMGTTAKPLGFAAAELAREAGDPALFARAALFAASGDSVGQSDPRVLTVLAEAQEMLAGRDLVLASLLLSSEADYRAYSDAVGWHVGDLAEEALALALAAGSSEARAQALRTLSRSSWGSSRVASRIEVVDELLALGRQTGRSLWVIWALNDRAVARLELGDRAGYEADRAAANAVARDNRWWFADSPERKVLPALIDGRFDEARRLADAHITEPYHTGHDRDAINVYAGWLLAIAHEQGRAGELVDLVAATVADNPHIAVFRAGLALCHTDLGDKEAAAREFGHLARDEFAGVPRDQTYPITMAVAEACACLGDRHAAAVLGRLFGEHSGLVTALTGGQLTVGAVDRYLGMLATTTGDHRRAQAYFEAALALESGLEAPPLIARTKLWYARLLLARGEVDDRQRAVTLVHDALTTARALGMAGVVRDAEALARE